MTSEIGFKNTMVCPVCNELHEVNYMYKDVPMLACSKMEPDKLLFINGDKMENAQQIQTQDLVKIWSFEHDAWWAPDSRGYTSSEERAGLYERKIAEDIVHRANYGDELNEQIVELRQLSLKERVAALIREINAQDNRCTASPYYYAVQSKRWIPGDWGNDAREVFFDDEGNQIDQETWLAEDETRTEDEWDDLDKTWVSTDWQDKGVFLTESAALLYMKANAHHLTEPRTYVKHFWRNSQMELVMQALEEFSGEKLRRT